MKINKSILFILSCILIVGCSSKNSSSNIENRVEELLSKMTLNEKVGQLNQINTSNDVNNISGNVINGEIGSILNEVDPIKMNELQKIAIEQSRLGIPIIFARDVIHGFKTIFPIPLGQAASFNPQIAKDGARVAAIEASSVGIRWTFAPMIDVARDPRWGRVAEGCGEDPYLTSVMGAAMVKGYQGDSLNNPTSIAACAKHFIGYGAAEGGKDYNSTYIPERQMRNVYLPPFEAAAKAGAATFMTSFNANNGIPATANKFLLTSVLRGEWGFKGFVVTDWASAKEMIAHGFCENGSDAAQKSLDAGVDMDMVANLFLKELPKLVEEGKVSEEQINDAVRNVLRVKFQLGLFDNPYVDTTAKSILYAQNHLELAKQAAIESAVLLKNEGALPINKKYKNILVVGPLADAPHDQLGTWVFDGDKEYTETPLKAIKERYGKEYNISYISALDFSRDNNTKSFSRAIAAARRADVVIAFVGEEAILSGEAHSLADISLKGAQTKLISELSKINKPLVTVVIAGRPLTIEQEVNESDALLFSFHPGTKGGSAIAELLFGDAVPSGKLPMTFPKMVGQIPIYYSQENTGRPASGRETLLDDIPVEAGQTSLGCTSFYLDAGFYPLFPFGYGLSYTTFEYGKAKLSAKEYKTTDTLSVTVNLRNSGKYDATEVVQLYVKDCVGSVTRPVKELKGFKRVSLRAGESKEVKFNLPISDLAFWGIDMKKSVEPGNFSLWVAGDSNSGEAVNFNVK